MHYYVLERDIDYLLGNFKKWPNEAIRFAKHGPNEQDRAEYVYKRGALDGDILTQFAWSTRLVQALLDGGMTGWNSYPIEVTDRQGEIVDGFVGVRVTGTGGELDDVKSGMRRRGRIIDGYDAVFMDEDGWDGSDVFMIPRLGINVFLSERAAEIVQGLGLRGGTLVRNDLFSSGLR